MSRRAERRERRLRERGRVRDVADLIESDRRLRTAGYAAGTTCFVCHGELGQHGDDCFMRPGAMTAPRGGIEYLRASGWARETTPLYDELAAERGIDPCGDAQRARLAEQARDMDRLARSWSVPGPMLVLPADSQPQVVLRGTQTQTADLTKWPPHDPIVARAWELYDSGHLGDVGSFSARRALARLISTEAISAHRPRSRTGWGQPIERTGP